jgi:hypothetical protein
MGKKDLDFFLIVMMVVIFPLIRVCLRFIPKILKNVNIHFIAKKKNN